MTDSDVPAIECHDTRHCRDALFSLYAPHVHGCAVCTRSISKTVWVGDNDWLSVVAGETFTQRYTVSLRMNLSRSLIETKAEEYESVQPFFTVEAEHIEILPGMLTDGDYGWRDLEWVVQWYFRRYLGAYPNRERREIEDAFGENTYEEVMVALDAVTETDDTEEKFDHLCSLAGVDVRVASAFLFFMFPETYLPVGDREWGALREFGYVDEPYSDRPSVEQYLSYHESCRELVEEYEVDPWTLYRALWRVGSEQSG